MTSGISLCLLAAEIIKLKAAKGYEAGNLSQN